MNCKAEEKMENVKLENARVIGNADEFQTYDAYAKHKNSEWLHYLGLTYGLRASIDRLDFVTKVSKLNESLRDITNSLEPKLVTGNYLTIFERMDSIKKLYEKMVGSTSQSMPEDEGNCLLQEFVDYLNLAFLRELQQLTIVKMGKVEMVDEYDSFNKFGKAKG